MSIIIDGLLVLMIDKNDDLNFLNVQIVSDTCFTSLMKQQ